MAGGRGKRPRGGDDPKDGSVQNSTVNVGIRNTTSPGPSASGHQKSHHSVDTVLAQAGGVGHRSLNSHTNPNVGFLGDTTGSIIPPIFPSTTYARDSSRGGYDMRVMPTYPVDEISEHAANDDDDANTTQDTLNTPTTAPLMYSRPDNPTYIQAESLLASLEGGERALVFSSGMAAVAAVASATLKHGDRCCVPKSCYFAVRVFFQDWCERSGVTCVLYDCEIEGDLKRAVYGVTQEVWDATSQIERYRVPGTGSFDDKNCKLIWVETPSNPTWRVTDIRAAAALAKQVGATLCCDATVLTPLVCRPLELGADLVMHSATKYLNGHSDVVAGAVVGRKSVNADDPQKQVFAQLQKMRSFHGPVLGPFEAWLLLRGMRTLHVRVRQQCKSAMFLARKLQKHESVLEVHYPGLTSHPGHSISKEQQSYFYPAEQYEAEEGVGANSHVQQKKQSDKMFGGMLSIRVNGGKDVAVLVTALVKIWFPATSLGGVESLVEHRKTVEGVTSETPDDLLRLSVGLENAGDLWEDLSSAIERAAKEVREGKGPGGKLTSTKGTSKETPPNKLKRTGDSSTTASTQNRMCLRGCRGLVAMSDSTKHARVKGKPYCVNSDGIFIDWMKKTFPDETNEFFEKQTNTRPGLRR